MKPWLLPASRPTPAEPAPSGEPGTELAYPVGRAVVEPFDKAHGHDDSLFVPEEYGDYLATSADIYAAAQLRARLVSSVRIRLFKGSDENKREQPTSPAAQLLRFVNPHWTEARLARMDELSMCLWGESYWAIEKDAAGQPKEIWWLKPSRVKPVPDENDYIVRYLYESNVNGQVLRFNADEIVWFRYPNPLDEFSAMSPVAAARLAADTGSAMMKSNQRLHTNGAQAAGIVTPTGDRVRYTKEQADQLGDDIQTRLTGTKNAHRWAVLRYEAKFHPLHVTPKDAEYLGGMALTLRQVCNAYGVPAPLLNDLEHATLANLREFQKALWEHALVPDLGLRAQEIEEQFLPMFRRETKNGADHVEHDFSRVAALQESQSATWDRDRQAIEVGGLTINEWRAKQGQPPVAWGDVYWAPVNKVPVSSDAAPGADGEDAGVTALERAKLIAEVSQKVYLAVGPVLVDREARQLLIDAGMDIPVDKPAEPGEDEPPAEDSPPGLPPAIGEGDAADAADAADIEGDAELAGTTAQWARVLAALEGPLELAAAGGTNGHGGT
jgi:HK97 family phage portal protein